MSKPAPSFYEFGPFRLDTVKRLLLRDGEVVPLPPKAFDTLLALVNNSDRVVEKSELMTAIWPDSFVEESNLTQNVSILRKALGERAGEHRYIVTVPGRGYRFVAGVGHETNHVTGLILERHAITQIVAEQEILIAEGEIEAEKKLAGESCSQSIQQSSRGLRLNPILLIVCALALAGLVVAASYFLISRSSPLPKSILEVKSIAVLPFKSLGEDSGDEHLGLGMADTLITRLSRLSQITVRPTSAILKYSAPEQDPVEAGRELGVEAVLDGRIQKSGERLRVTAQLVRISDGKTIWADKFEENMTDIFAVQDSICERMAEGLSLELTGEERERLTRRYTQNPQAYQAYMKGRYWWNKRSTEGFRKAIEYFNQAIALDGNYALAHAGLADCYAILSPYGRVAPSESYPKAREAAEKALKIDDQLAEAHTSLANIIWLYDWDWTGAEREFKRAIELSPNYPTAHQWYSAFLSSLARHKEAIAEAQRAQELDPLSVPISRDLARAFYHARQYDQTILAALKILELDPNHYRINNWLDLAYEQKGLYDEAIEVRLKAMSVIGVRPEEIEMRRAAYHVSGWKGYWQTELELTKKRAQQKYVLPYNFARICARLGEKEQALAWLEKAYKEHSDHLVLLKVDPIFDDLRDDLRFEDLLRRVGLDR